MTFWAFFNNFSRPKSEFAEPICTVLTTSPPFFQQTCTPVAPDAVLNFRINAISTSILPLFPTKVQIIIIVLIFILATVWLSIPLTIKLNQQIAWAVWENKKVWFTTTTTQKRKFAKFSTWNILRFASIFLWKIWPERAIFKPVTEVPQHNRNLKNHIRTYFQKLDWLGLYGIVGER